MISLLSTVWLLFTGFGKKGLGYSCFGSFDDVLEVYFDVSSRGFRPEARDMVAEEVRHADAVVLTYACDRAETLERLSTYWLPELRRLEVCFSCLFSVLLCQSYHCPIVRRYQFFVVTQSFAVSY